MTTFRPNDEVLAYVRRRASEVHHRRRLLAGGVTTALAILSTVVVLTIQRDPHVASVAPPDTATSATSPAADAAPPAVPLVELLDPASTGLPSTFVPSAIAAGPDGYVVVGSIGFFDPDPEPGQVWFSVDGRSWESVGDDIFSSRNVVGVTGTDSRYLIATMKPERELFVSDDGRAWQPAPVALDDDDPVHLSAAGGWFFRVDFDEMLSSADGLTWASALSADGAPVRDYAQVMNTGKEFVAIAADLDGGRRVYRSTDAVTWMPASGAPPASSGVAAGDGQVVLALQGEPEGSDQCRLGAVNPAGAPVTTIAPSPCRYPTSFAILDATSGSTTATSGPVFFTSEEWSFLTPWHAGYLAMSRDGTTGAVWSSPDGLAWAASDIGVPLGTGRPVIAAGPAGAVILAGAGPPQVALVTLG